MKPGSDLLRFESAHSGLIFREKLYSRQQDPELVRDLLGLANANVPGARWLVFGVGDQDPAERTFPGIDPDQLKPFGRHLLALAERVIEPTPRLKLSAFRLKEGVVAVVTISECGDPPYLVREPVGPLLPGTGFVRRGTATASLRREDLAALFARSDNGPAAADDAASEDGPGVRLLFAAARDSVAMTLPVLPIGELPSARAARQLRSMLSAREQSRTVFDRTQTALHRLIHARVYGADTPFEDRSEATLVDRLSRSVDEYAGPDDHHRFETRAHRLDLLVENRLATAIRDAKLSITIRLVDGTGISGGVYGADGTIAPGSGYPVIEHDDARTVRIECTLDILPANAAIRAFRESPRLWAREAAINAAVAIDYSIAAPGLDAPQNGTLTLQLTGAEPVAATGT